MKKSALFATCLSAASALCAADLVTLTGKTYTGVTIKRVDPDGLAIVHESGAAKIPFTQLSEDLRVKFGYDPAKAEAAIKEQKEAEAKHRENTAAIEAKAAEAKKTGLTGGQSTGSAAASIRLRTAGEIKAAWLQALVEPAGLDRDFRKKRDANAKTRAEINAGLYDEFAQDEANRVNISIFLANGRTEEAKVLQLARMQYANQVTQAAELKEQSDSMQNRALIQMGQEQMLQYDIQRLKRAVDDLNR